MPAVAVQPVQLFQLHSIFPHQMSMPGKACCQGPVKNGIPEGWQRKELSKLADFLNGYAFKPSDWFDNGLPIIKIREHRFGFLFHEGVILFMEIL